MKKTEVRLYSGQDGYVEHALSVLRKLNLRHGSWPWLLNYYERALALEVVEDVEEMRLDLSPTAAAASELVDLKKYLFRTIWFSMCPCDAFNTMITQIERKQFVAGYSSHRALLLCKKQP